MYEFFIYLGGMFIAFCVVAFAKGTWVWKGETVSSHGTKDDDTWIAFIIVLFWWICLPVIAVIQFFSWLYDLFNWSIVKTGLAIDFSRKIVNDANNRIIHSWNSRKENRSRTRKKVAVPAPILRQSYREPGPHPCIACGIDTSIDQSNMSVVLNEELTDNDVVVVVEDIVNNKRKQYLHLSNR